MPTPHVHALLIKAWADGAEIEYREVHWLDKNQWEDTTTPQWGPLSQYRIKPTPKPKVTRWLWVHKHKASAGPWVVATHYATESEFEKWTSYQGIKLEWSAMEFDE